MKDKIEIGDLFINSSTRDVFMLCQWGGYIDQVVLIDLKTGKCWNSPDDSDLKGSNYKFADRVKKAMDCHGESMEWIPIQRGCSVSVIQS